MAAHGLGRSEEARRALAEADELWTSAIGFVSAPGDPSTPTGPGPGCWDFIRADMLRREAKARIEGTDPGEDPRLRAYQERVRGRLKHPDPAPPGTTSR